MACDLVFSCDDCGAQSIQHPLAGQHSELRVRLCYPDGWGWDADGERALCPGCVAAASVRTR
jgi:hypothetical protein